jgi:predicted nucleic acid-binding protein
MIYFDTNVFINAVTKDRKYGKSCTKIMDDVEAGKVDAVCSRLVLVEFVNSLTHINRELRRHAREPFQVPALTNALISLVPNWYELNDQVVRRASARTEKMNPADYFHIATMEVAGIEKIVSADSDFDKVGWVKRIDPLKFQATGKAGPE